MVDKINTEEPKSMIANEIKDIGLHTVLNQEAMKKIQDKVMSAYNLDKAKSEIPELIPEAAAPIPVETSGPAMGSFPAATAQDLQTGSTETQQVDSASPINNGMPIDAGTSGNIPAYGIEIPDFIKKIEPGKVIVFSQNELSEGGENLSNKPLRTYENPDIKKSMHDLWMDKGQMKAEVYIAKLEKIGELEFNYANGTTQFVEKRFDPDFEMQAKYKENPYMNNAGPATPGALDINGQPNLAAQIASSVDLNQIVTDIVMNILRNQLMTNTTKAVNDIPPTPVGEFASNFDTRYIPKNVNEISPNEPMGYSTASAVKPMEEGFRLKMIDLVNDYSKIDAPEKLKEAITKNDKSHLTNENAEVQEWEVDGKLYYTPVNKISIKKCYTK